VFLNLCLQKQPRRAAANFTKTSLDECLELLASTENHTQMDSRNLADSN